jgi:glutamyl-tRNA reductase
LALPRDVEASAAKLQNVFVYNLDDLAKIADENRAAREAEIERCRALLDERLNNLWRDVYPRLERWEAITSPSLVATPLPTPRI